MSVLGKELQINEEGALEFVLQLCRGEVLNLEKLSSLNQS